MFKKNTDNSYAPLSKFFHMIWGTLVLICYGSMYYKELFLAPKDPLSKALIVNIHKPFGTLLLVLMMFAYAWRLLNNKPKFSESMASWEVKFANFVHWSLYFFLMFTPLTGFLLTTATGFPVEIFGLFKVPLLFDKSDELKSFFHSVHETLALFGLILIFLHIAGVLKQEIIRKDHVLKKIFPRFFFKEK